MPSSYQRAKRLHTWISAGIAMAVYGGFIFLIGGEWIPYQQHIDAGRFEVKTGSSDGGHAFNQAKFTPKGVNWIANLWQAQK